MGEKAHERTSAHNRGEIFLSYQLLVEVVSLSVKKLTSQGLITLSAFER